MGDPRIFDTGVLSISRVKRKENFRHAWAGQRVMLLTVNGYYKIITNIFDISLSK